MPANTANGKKTAMADKYDEMAQQMRALIRPSHH